MTYSSYKVKTPGKLMIAGEYAVLEPKQKAVVIGINRYVTVHIKPCKQNKPSLSQRGSEDITWEIRDGKVQFSVDDSSLGFIKNSISVVKQFLQEKSVILHPFQLEIRSDLDDPLTGKKYGLGSSAAVVVAVISAMLQLSREVKEPPALEEIFKLSAIAHLKTQENGSGADVAAAVYGGWIEYSAFDGKWLLNQLEQGMKLRSVIEKPWPNLSIRPLTPPPLLQLAVGWTKKTAATAPMIRSFQHFRHQNIEAYKEFLSESSIAVEALIQSFEARDYTESINSVAQNRKALLKLGEEAGITIETDKLKTLCSIAETFGSGKSSGAGGGDCGIAFLKDSASMEELHNAWKEADITPLNLTVSNTGVSIEKIAVNYEGNVRNTNKG
ncbi:phosphomevalonate kinase [Desnuesiella massiliensis]|uniref:phosphomevalonate kinase n=1 Tax=Desnuesiella massiliensis TaxID=1650662 RepID=UPI0006E2A415|nr:phosphomevalonate kinase [Desnuesiella massiliensis]